MRVTTKGQVTIPGRIRRKLNIRPGDEVAFVEDGDKVVVLKTSHGVEEAGARFESLLDELAKLGANSEFRTTDEALDVLRGADRND